MPTILLADDEASLRKLLCRFLQLHGYEVYVAADGLQALRLGEELDGKLDLLLADIRMPGMPGTELARRLRAALPDLKILFISGFAEEYDMTAPLLQKPFDPSELLKVVKNLLGPPESQIRGK